MTLQGKDFEAVNIPEARATVSPDLQLALRGQEVTLNGSVLVPEAAIKLRELPQSAVGVSSDVVVVSSDPASAPPPGGSPFKVNARLELRLGEKVSFSGFGLDAELAGAIRVREEPDRIPIGVGELRIVKGTYKAYGQDLTISRGRLIFAGPVDNPGLDVRATRKVGDVTAGLRVGGTAKASVVTLFSDPRMQESEVLSYLLLGRPLKQASGSDSELLMGAVGSLGLKGGDFVAKQLGRSLGLDEVGVQSEGGLDKASLVLGRYLSPKLYLSYGIGLFEPSSSVRMRYELTRRLTLQATGGTESGMDVIYTIEK
jgi:translocation and assembly module TamB